jgi:hypothetical protein
VSFTLLIRSLISLIYLTPEWSQPTYCIYLSTRHELLPYNHSQTNVFFRGVCLKIEGCEGGLSCIWENAVCSVCASAWLKAGHVPVCSRYCVPKCPSHFSGYYMMWHITVMLRVCFWSEQHHHHKITFANLALISGITFFMWTSWYFLNRIFMVRGFSHFSTLCRNSDGHLGLYTL